MKGLFADDLVSDPAMGLIGEVIRRRRNGSVPLEVIIEHLQAIAEWQPQCQMLDLTGQYFGQRLDMNQTMTVSDDRVTFRHGNLVVLITLKEPKPLLCTVPAVGQCRIIGNRYGVTVVNAEGVVFSNGKDQSTLANWLPEQFPVLDHPEGIAIVWRDHIQVCPLPWGKGYTIDRVSGDPYAPEWTTHPLGLLEHEGEVYRLYTAEKVYSWTLPQAEQAVAHPLGIVHWEPTHGLVLNSVDVYPRAVVLWDGKRPSLLWSRRIWDSVPCLVTPSGVYVHVTWADRDTIVHCSPPPHRDRVVVEGKSFGQSDVDVDENGVLVCRANGIRRFHLNGRQELLFPPYGKNTFIAHPRGAVMNMGGKLWLIEPKKESSQTPA